MVVGSSRINLVWVVAVGVSEGYGDGRSVVRVLPALVEGGRDSPVRHALRCMYVSP
jgi:hypothetical protein